MDKCSNCNYAIIYKNKFLCGLTHEKGGELKALPDCLYNDNIKAYLNSKEKIKHKNIARDKKDITEAFGVQISPDKNKSGRSYEHKSYEVPTIYDKK